MIPPRQPAFPRSASPEPRIADRQRTDRFEAAFLEQMLKYMGPQAREGAGSGGAGEAQFQSFLTQEYARILAERIDLKLTRGAKL